MKRMNRQIPTLWGIIAIVLWSTAIAFSRSVTEKIGTFNTAFFNLLFSGIFLLLLQLLIYKKQFFRKIAALPFAYLYKVGTFMVLYMTLFYIAVGEAKSREAVITIGIINYLWPGLAFVFSIPILKNKAKYSLLIFGILVAFAGTTTAVLEGYQLSLVDIKSAIYSNITPYIFAFIAAVSWGVYSNMTRKFQVKEDVTALPILFLVSAFVILVLQLLRGETPQLSLSGAQYLEFAYLVIFPTAIAYLFWDNAMKRGNKNLVVAVSYLIPLASTLISGYYLNVTIGSRFGIAAILVICGAVLCRRSIIEKTGDKL
ncbi:MAG: EamA family transporter [bacterium]|nr:EamA family transporter [bacterium]